MWLLATLGASGSFLNAQTTRPAAPASPAAEEFVRPKLVLNGEGHTSPLRALTYTRDGKYLLSGGTDKVVHVWELVGSRLKLRWSIRPPLNRKAGWVYAVAATGALADGSYRVAVAGHGASLQAGEIGLYRFPPRKDFNSGDRDLLLESDTADKPLDQRIGHSMPVFGLDFSDDGRFLASCSQDKLIRVWDLESKPRPRTIATLAGHTNEVSRVAFLAGDLLVSAGGAGDGSLRIWNWREGGRWKQRIRPSDEDLRLGEGVRINALAVSRDHAQIAVGRENGRLELYSAGDLAVNRVLNPTEVADRRPVEALSFSPDGKTLASSIFKEKLSFEPTIMTRPDCVVAVRPIPAGEPVTVVAVEADRVKALAFDPSDPNRLALGGGAAQSVVVRGLQPPSQIASNPGPGTVIWNVAFDGAGPTVAYARHRPDPGKPWQWEAFNLATGRARSVADESKLAGSLHSYRGWSVKVAAEDRREFLFTLIAVSPEGREVALRLSPEEDVRWTCYSFIPPTPGGGDRAPMIAVGSRSGSVSFFTLPEGRKTRVFSGHAEAVYAVAPSPDRRWLVTGSADQTIRLWTLKGIEQPPTLGATLAVDAQGGLAVSDVVAPSFAWEMGLRKGDRIIRCTRNLSGLVVDGDAPGMLRVIEGPPNGTAVELQVRRAEQNIRLRSTRRGPFGAGLAADSRGGLSVGAVADGSPAQEMGLRDGDRVVGMLLELPVGDAPTFEAALRAVEPGIPVVFETLRGRQPRRIQTARWDPPALNLFIGRDLEWIVWMPEGYYHSSVQGDRELLGWHVNREPIVATTTTFFPMSRFAGQLRRPDAIRTLLGTGDVVAAIRRAQAADPPQVGQVQPPPVAPVIVAPPRIRIVTPDTRAGTLTEVQNPEIRLRVEVTPGQDRSLSSLVFLNGNVPNPARIDPAAPSREFEQLVPLHLGVNSISIVATDSKGVVGRENLQVALKPATILTPTQPRLLVRTIGVEAFRGRDLTIRYAGNDAEKVREFLSKAGPATGPRFESAFIDASSLTGPELDAPRIARAFDELAALAKDRKLGTGDTVFIFLNSHVVSVPKLRAAVLGANAEDQPSPVSSVASSVVTDRIRALTARGCLVILMLDGIHQFEQASQQNFDDLNDWIRDLTEDTEKGGGAIVLLASKQSPSQIIERDGLGVFAGAILGSTTVAGQAGPLAAAASPTLDEFKRSVEDQVQEATERKQIVGFYTPESLQSADRDRIRVFEPQPARIEELAGR